MAHRIADDGLAEHYLSKVAALALAGDRRVALGAAGAAGAELRVTVLDVVLEAGSRNGAQPCGVLNQNDEVVMSMKPMNLLRCRNA